jgi:uncharacterized membrane protein
VGPGARHLRIEYLSWLLAELVACIRWDGAWMTWNTILAAVPVVLAAFLFTSGRRRTARWWAGVALFALFLPNAPYVITDLIHLRWSVARAPSDGVVLLGVIPMYVGFLTVGLVGYVYCVDQVAWEVRDRRPDIGRWRVVLAVHTWSALGVVVGRLSRLNSWDAVTQPGNSLERIFVSLSWRGAPVAFAAVWLSIVVAYGLVHPLVHTFLRWTARIMGFGEPTAVATVVGPDPSPAPATTELPTPAAPVGVAAVRTATDPISAVVGADA